MTVKDCYLKFIKLLEIECDVADALKYFNLVEYELALEYFPLTMEETWSHYPKVYFEEFKCPVSLIVNCENPTTKVYSNYLLTKNKKPLGKIKYYYLPEQKQYIDDISNYSSECLNCIVYGMLSEYHIMHGEYEIASMWFSKYKQEIKRLKLLNIDLTKREDDKPYSLYVMDEDDPYQIINHETTAIRRCAENEGKFIDLLNQEIKGLTSSLIEKTFLPTIEKELGNAKTQLDTYMTLRAEVDNDNNVDEDVKKFYSKQEIWWDGQFTAYQNMIDILKGDK